MSKIETQLRRAQVVTEYLEDIYNGGDDKDNLCDLLADLLVADRLAPSGIASAVASALRHYEEEAE